MLAAIKKGFIQKEIADTSYRYQREMEEKKKVTVGVNAYKINEASPIETLKIADSARTTQVGRLREVKKTRDATLVREALTKLRKSFGDSESNCMYPMLKAVKSYATLGEIVNVGREVFGEWKEPSIL
jgi:methylmalonyl-CoA mutase N-terminal domain/subunit